MGRFNISTNNSSIDGYVDIYEHDISNVSNNSRLNINVYLHRTNNYSGNPSASSGCVFYIKIDNDTYTIDTGYVQIPNNKTYVNVASLNDILIKHNDDGSKTVRISVSGNVPYSSFGFSEQGEDYTLTKIPRASNIAVSNTNLGQNIVIVIGKLVNTFTSTLTYEIGSLTGTIVEKTTLENYPWVMSEELIGQIKNAYPSNNQINAIVRCKTYDGDTQIGSTKSATFVLSIVDKPLITSAIRNELNENISSLTNSVLRSASCNKFTINATAPVGTSIAYYRVKNGDADSGYLTSNEVTLNNIQSFYKDSDGNLKTKFIVTCQDERGNESDGFEVVCDFINYINVSINKTDTLISRSSNVSTDAKITLQGNFYNGQIGTTANTIQIKCKYKKQGTTTYSELMSIDYTAEENKFNVSNFAIEGTFNYQDNYEFIFYVTDLIGTEDSYEYLFKNSVSIVKVHKNGMYIKQLDTDTMKINKVKVDSLIYKQTLLYDYENGSDDTITLNDKVTNYDYIEIYGKNSGNDSLPVLKIWEPLNKTALLNYFNWDTGILFCGKVIKINEQTIEQLYPVATYINSNKNIDYVYNSGSERIKIFKVIAYKKIEKDE